MIYTIQSKNLACLLILCLMSACSQQNGVNEEKTGRFDMERDLLLLHYDCKTDVDDLHSVAAAATLLSQPDFEDVNVHAVAGAYGTQDGPYVPPNDLFQLAFGENWSDAHADFDRAVSNVKEIARPVLENSGDLWIADAGQSDFSAALVEALVADMPDLNPDDRIHIIQHSDWNEEVTSQDALRYVKEKADYHKIPDGNATDNGTPGFRSPENIDLDTFISDQHLLSVWELAIDLGNQYNGADGRYLNEAIEAGGLDFSDFSEVCWIFGMEHLRDAEDYFNRIKDM
ncbi:MAG: hypothetical protein R3220_04400 [Balneolaceae bacterium]|nr:hypothetical protein [Balneolaceae bacterium]